MAVEIRRHTGPAVQAVENQIRAVYQAVFSLPPYNEDESHIARFVERFREHWNREGFRFYGAWAADADRLLGFAYGHTLRPGTAWYDMLLQNLDPQVVETWLSDCFDLTELAVLPSAQGHGLGGRLHDAVLAGLPHRTAVLATFPAETPAMPLYRKRGWVSLAKDLDLPGQRYALRVLGLKLRTEQQV